MGMSPRHSISEQIRLGKGKCDREGEGVEKNTLESLTGEATDFLFLSL